jgi:hypothetical protein
VGLAGHSSLGGDSVLDVPVPPSIVIESPAPCSDAARAKELLQRTLGPALAPRSSWTVIARFSRRGSSLVVEGEITDEVDSPVAHRVLTETSQECSSLARAVGVWAALVLDTEVERAAQPPPPAPTPAPQAWPTAPPVEKPPRDVSVLLDGAERPHSLELGVTMTLMGGEGSGVMAGPTLYGIVEAGKGWFLRPSVFLSRTLQELTSTSDVYGTLVATRFDACGRISGFHIKRIMFDLCGGAELGFMHFDTPSLPEGKMASTTNSTLPYLALGPSVSLRGELGGGLALDLRGVADLNVVREGFSETGTTNLTVTPSLFIGRGELGLSWELR